MKEKAEWQYDLSFSFSCILKTQGLAGKVAVTGQDEDIAVIKIIIKGTQLMTVLKSVSNSFLFSGLQYR